MRGKKIYTLLIEDDLGSQKFARNLLSQNGFNVEVSPSTLDSLEVLRNKTLEPFASLYDLLIVDINLPDFNGYELVRTLKLTEPSISNIKIIALTADLSFSDPTKKQQLFDCGINDVFFKPLTNEIINSIKEKYFTN